MKPWGKAVAENVAIHTSMAWMVWLIWEPLEPVFVFFLLGKKKWEGKIQADYIVLCYFLASSSVLSGETVWKWIFSLPFLPLEVVAAKGLGETSEKAQLTKFPSSTLLSSPCPSVELSFANLLQNHFPTIPAPPSPQIGLWQPHWPIWDKKWRGYSYSLVLTRKPKQFLLCLNLVW